MCKKISVIILNYARWESTLACVDSLCKGATLPSHIVIVDNASPDGSAFELQRWIELRKKQQAECSFLSISDDTVDYGKSVVVDNVRYSLLCMKHNGGYAAGNNAGISLALSLGADACWVLNNDTLVETGALEAMCSRMFAADEPGLCGSLLLYADEYDRVQCCGGGKTNPWTFLSTLAGNNLTREQAHQIVASDIEKSLNFIYGASLMVSRRFCETVGLMDESFFLYCEEQDWAWRGLRMGFKIGYAPTAIVYHHEGLTSGMSYRQKRLKRQLLLIRSRLKVTWKHHPYALPTVVLGCGYAGLRQCALSLCQRIRLVIRILRGQQ